MTILVGVVPDERGKCALRLANALALSTGEPLRLCTVINAAWPPSPERDDAEYVTLLERAAHAALAEAAENVSSTVTTTSELRHARSVSAGLLEASKESDVSYIVVGSSTAGALGRVTLGSVSDRLLHSSEVPVAIAPRDYAADKTMRVSRVTVAFGGTAEDSLVVAAGARAAELGADLRIASFVVHPVALFGGMIESQPEALVFNEWAQANSKAVHAALDRLREVHSVPSAVEVLLGEGRTWNDAIADVAWGVGDVLVVGSGSGGVLRQVFLGSQASKIIRHSPVPVICVPRRAAEEVADELAASRAVAATP